MFGRKQAMFAGAATWPERNHARWDPIQPDGLQGAGPELSDDMLQLAASAEIRSVAHAIHVRLHDAGGGRTVLLYYPEVHVDRTHWRNLEGKTGPAGLFTAGNAVHLAMEYGRLSFPEAVRAIVFAVLPPDPKARVGFRRQSAYLRLRGQHPEPAGRAELPAVSGDAEHREELLSWLEQRGILRESVLPLLAKGLLYRSATEPELIFPGTAPDRAEGGLAYALSAGETDHRRKLPHTGVFSAWVLPGIGSSVEVYVNPLELLAAIRQEGDGCGSGNPVCSRLALFPAGEEAALAYILTHGEIRQVSLCFGRREKDRTQAERLRGKLQPFVRVRERLPPEPRLSWLNAAGRIGQQGNGSGEAAP